MIRRIASRTFSRVLLQPYFRQARGMTLGTRTAVIDAHSRVLLVRHSYVPGWLLPGGGVERGESIYAAAARELREEAAIVAEEDPHLFGVYLNDRQFSGDHVACFVVRRFRQETFQPNNEILEARFFAHDRLPDDASPGTRRRIGEILLGATVAQEW